MEAYEKEKEETQKAPAESAGKGRAQCLAMERQIGARVSRMALAAYTS
jgi:hypothetical protein